MNMIKSVLLFSTLLVSLVMTIPTGNQVTFQFEQHDHETSDIIPGEYIVLLREKTGEEFLASHDQQFVDNTMFVYSHGFAAKLSQDQVSALQVDNDVLLVEKNQKVSIAKVQRGAPWGLARISQRELNWVDRYVYPSSAGQGVTVYVLDTGIKVDHAEFAGGKAKSGFNAFPEEGSDDLNSHGTQCASIVCGWKYGVAKRASVIGVKVLNQDGSGSYAGVIAGLDWSVQHFQNSSKKAVASMSLGGPKSVALETSVRKAVSAGLPVIVAAGNSAEDACISSPSGAAEAITVGAINLNGEFASFSNYGTCVDILAPGVDIRGAGIADKNSGLTYSGTSQATPHVAGAAALLLEKFELSPVELRKRLADTATIDQVTLLPEDTTDKVLFFNAYDCSSKAGDFDNEDEGN